MYATKSLVFLHNDSLLSTLILHGETLAQAIAHAGTTDTVASGSLRPPMTELCSGAIDDARTDASAGRQSW